MGIENIEFLLPYDLAEESMPTTPHGITEPLSEPI